MAAKQRASAKKVGSLRTKGLGRKAKDVKGGVIAIISSPRPPAEGELLPYIEQKR